VARKHRVSRPSFYTWTQRALDQLKKALKPEKKKNHSFLMPTVPKDKKSRSIQR
jgi:hypothetical protein